LLFFMAPLLSFVTANFVARQLGYKMEKGWQQGDIATQAWFSPLHTFPERFEAMLVEVKELGFTAIDLWGAHLHWHWATLQHVASARALLALHGLTVRSYAAWVPGDANDLHGACRFCAALDIPIIAGHIQLFAENRAAAVSILREHGIAYAIENHTEKSAADMWKRLGEGDEDLVGVALDTGWCATQGWDALAAVTELARRIKVVHLKDVRPRRTEKTGFEFIDMGHETCRLGDGVVPIKAILSTLRASGFRGPLGIEHEPEHFDPSTEARESRERVASWWDAIEVKEVAPPLRVVVVGCGNIAGGYGEAMLTRPEIKILGASDINPARAQAWVAKFGGRAYASLDEVLSDPAVETVVNLTIQQAHVEVVTRCLKAGKHVHTEKPLAPTYTEASQLVALADSLGLRLSCAPVAWLGEAQQTVWSLIREGRIGTPRVAYATVDWARIEAWHPNPAPFYAVGPVFDVAVYSLTMLTAWFGPVRRVVAGGGILLPDRKTKDGVPFNLTTDDFAVAILEFAGGMKARLTANFYVGEPAENRAGLEIHGDMGSISTAWFAATAKIRIGPYGGKYHNVPPVRPPTGVGEWYCDWSAGLFELWRALRTNQPHPTGGAHAAHVVDVMDSVHRSIKEGRAFELTSTFPEPKPLEWARH
jgi:predicted dehydrogenase/sugar phosphate isomerase/epimerase